MIIVTGTKRSGTSMWMQLMRAAGVPIAGEAFPMGWDQTIKDANPHGFYESSLRRGIYYATNPHPVTGAYLRPDQVQGMAVKVFIPGLVRSDLAYVEQVVATVRNWREYSGSLERLYALERDGREAVGKQAPKQPKIEPLLEWWLENYLLIRDIAIRQYPIALLTYDHVLEDPERYLKRVFGWLGQGDVDAAIAQVDPGARTQSRAEVPEPTVEPKLAEVFDELYDRIYRGQAIDGAFIERLNATQDVLMESLASQTRADPTMTVDRDRLRRLTRNPDWAESLLSPAPADETPT